MIDTTTVSGASAADEATAATGAETTAQKPDEKPKKKEDNFFVFIMKLAVVVLVFRSFFFSPFNIPSESMLPTLRIGDYLLAAKWPYGYSKYSLPGEVPLIPGRILAGQPERGDIAIFKHPIDGTDYIKRVIGLPGDTIEMRDGVLILNGTAVPKEPMEDFVVPVDQGLIDAALRNNQPTPCSRIAFEEFAADGTAQCRFTRFRETLPSGVTYEVLDFGAMDKDNFGPTIVPEASMFVMGDNRDNSQDSRFPASPGGGVGIVPQELLVARASMIMWSTDGSAEWVKPWTWFTAARGSRFGNGL